MEREKVAISIDIVRDMIKEIDIRLIPQLHDLDDYSEKQGIYRIGDYGYVPEKVFNKAFATIRRITEPTGQRLCTYWRRINRSIWSFSFRRTTTAAWSCWSIF